MRALSIVHVVFSSRIAGGEHHCVDLANAQAALGHTVHVIGPSGSAVRHALDPRVRYHGLRLPVLRGARVKRLAARLGADIVHGHLGPACKAVAAAKQSARVGTLHVGYKAHHHARMDALVCVNSAQVGHLKEYGGMHRVIYNWAPERNPGACAAKAASGSLRLELGLPASALVIGCVGRLHAAKGMHTLIEAFRRHAPAEAHLVLIGEGPQRAELEALRQDDPRIHLLGFRWNVDELLAEMDLYVSSSREEQFPLAILEAMRARLPIVATATLGAREMLDPARSAIVPVDDAPAMGVAIAEALEQRLRGGRRPVDYDMDRYDRSTAVRATLGLYQDVLSRQGVAVHDMADLRVEDARG
ncbi:glycosyltransferase [Mitsuaria sp. GD03876]|uniref:glycosyltransferase n=1 Tax=Mitsuaria sp. GD03876 TaxID=2975399 RepID=UPI002447DB3E|nr:glycosyltransferase [Mitsuaria sp. GD03876]MDH0866056.1 glycosyltransferase [Mitsuaria sp. GD03876]